jgi:hypothetical protein
MHTPNSDSKPVDDVARLFDESADPTALYVLQRPRSNLLPPESVSQMREMITQRQDLSCYLPLMYLRDHSVSEYEQLPVHIRAKILCEALKRQLVINDWGYMAEDRSSNGPAMRALVELGKPAIEYVIPLLSSGQFVHHTGSAISIMDSRYRYRRSDFAYHAIMSIENTVYQFDPNPDVRDGRIEDLKQRVRN